MVQSISVALLALGACALSPPARQTASLTKRFALLNAPRKDDGWYKGIEGRGFLSTDPGAAGKVPDAAAAFAEGIGAGTKFADVIDAIDASFSYADVKFSVGKVSSAAGENVGSSKILSFALLTKMDTEKALQCFGEYYADVKGDPAGTDHANIRAIISGGIEAASFPFGLSLTAKLVDEEEEYTSAKGLEASSSIGAGDEWDVDSDIWIPVDGVEM